jgi:hypothetical protein
MRASGYERIDDDWYSEPRWAIDALLDVEPFTGLCWDPSCGGGNIPEAIKARGLECAASDIKPRGYGDVFDFLAAGERADNIITNPPYGIVERYIRHALSLTNKKVAILARLALLEGIKRQALFRSTPLARVWVSSRRMSMPPGGSDIPAKGGAIAYAWFVWEHGHVGNAKVDWL